jgi:hypothetical protein
MNLFNLVKSRFAKGAGIFSIRPFFDASKAKGVRTARDGGQIFFGGDFKANAACGRGVVLH